MNQKLSIFTNELLENTKIITMTSIKGPFGCKKESGEMESERGKDWK